MSPRTEPTPFGGLKIRHDLAQATKIRVGDLASTPSRLSELIAERAVQTEPTYLPSLRSHSEHGTYGDAFERLAELEDLRSGWLNGDGREIDATTILAARAMLVSLQSSDSPAPYMYPMPSGGVQAEWTLGNWELEIKCDPLGRDDDLLRLQALNLRTDEVLDGLIRVATLSQMIGSLLGTTSMNTLVFSGAA